MNRPTAKMESIRFLQWSENKMTNITCLVALNCSKICSCLGIFQVAGNSLNFFFFLLVNTFFKAFICSIRNIIIRLAPRAGKMKRRILCSDWQKRNCLVSFGWILASLFFTFFMDIDFDSVHKNVKRKFGQYPAILTSRLVNTAFTS